MREFHTSVACLLRMERGEEDSVDLCGEVEMWSRCRWLELWKRRPTKPCLLRRLLVRRNRWMLPADETALRGGAAHADEGPHPALHSREVIRRCRRPRRCRPPASTLTPATEPTRTCRRPPAFSLLPAPNRTFLEVAVTLTVPNTSISEEQTELVICTLP